MQVLSDLYKGFAQKILDNIPDILSIDIWNGQTEPFFGEENQLPLPSVFIDMRATEIQTIGENLQDLTMRVTFHVATDSLQDTRISRNKDYTISKIHELTSALHVLFQGYRGEFFQGTMMRKAIYPYEAATNILQIAQEYEFHVIDDSSERIYDEVNFVEISLETGEKPVTIGNDFQIDL
jgi:hypothetical protein